MEEYTNKKRFSVKKFFLITLLILNVLAIGLIVAAGITYLLEEHQVEVDKQKQQALYANILDGVSTKPEELTVDFSHSISKGSPLIFGGNHGPKPTEQDAWNKLAQVGVTSMRNDFSPDEMLPSNITLQDYINNVNDVQNPKNWNWTAISRINATYTNAKSRGMTTIGILSYIPTWLSDSGTRYGVPKDWNIYKDIVEKVYSIYRKNLDYIEIWNEPSYYRFLDLTNSNLTREEAYKKIFEVSAEAIREVDAKANDGKKAKIGGPVTYIATDTSLLESLLQDPSTRKQLDFVSYHSYDKQNTGEPSDKYVLSVLKKYNAQNIPIFLTEWNYDYSWNNPTPYNDTNKAIIYTAEKLISYLQWGLAGANYFTMESVNTNYPNQGKGTYAFFQTKGSTSTLLPQSKTWNLLSQQLGLGKGESYIYKLSPTNKKAKTEPFQTIGFKNTYGDNGLVIINASSSASLKFFNLKNTKLNKFVKVQVYSASDNNDAKSVLYKGIVETDNDSLNFGYNIPANSVVGIIFSNQSEWYNFLPLPINNLIQ